MVLALLLGEIIFLNCDKGEWGINSHTILLLFFITTLFGVVFLWSKQSYGKKCGILTAILFMGILCAGYRICQNYEKQIQILDIHFQDEEECEVVGEITDIEEKENSIFCYVKQATIRNDTMEIKGVKLVLILLKQEESESGELLPGNYIVADITNQTLEAARNEGEFDEKEYYYSIGISGKGLVSQYEIVQKEGIWSEFKRNLYALKQNLKERIQKLSDTHYAGIFEGILLGEKSAILEETKELYQLAGISHILSISGLHISLIGYFVHRFFRKRFGMVVSSACSVILLGLYAIFTGGGFSTVRAVIMFSVHLFADILGRTYDLLSALSVSFCILVVCYPFCIFHSGFLLSFGAILGIQPLFSTVCDYLQIQNRLGKSWLAGICVNVMTRPVVISIYNEIPIYSSILNLFVISCMSIMVSCGFLGIFLSFLWFDLGSLIFRAGCKILWLYEVFSRISLSFPHATQIIKSPEQNRILLYYLIMGFAIMLGHRYMKNRRNEEEKVCFRKKIPKYLVASLVYLILLGILVIQPKKIFEVKMLDVGQGDSILIQNQGQTILIDAGSSSESEITKYTILPFLKANGVTRLDYLILTHSDSDHANGMIELLEYQQNKTPYVKYLVLPDIGADMKDSAYMELEEVAKKQGISVLYFSRGCRLESGEMQLKCIWPQQGANQPDKNNLSLVFLLEYQEFQMLFTGDLAQEGEQMLLKLQEEDLQKELEDIDVLKVGHHGSDGSSSQIFLEVLKPKISLISCGRNNRYGHPGTQALSRLLDGGSDIYVTMETGEIQITVNENGFSVETFLHSPYNDT